MNLSAADNASIADGRGVATITDDDLTKLSVDDVTVTEGDTGAVNATFVVSLSNPNSRTVRTGYTTADDSALAPGDYTKTTGVLEIPAGDMTGTITVPVSGDLVDELDERYTLKLSEPVNAMIVDGEGAGTIVDDDQAKLSVDDVTVTEGNAGTVNATFKVIVFEPERPHDQGRRRHGERHGGGAGRLLGRVGRGHAGAR